LGSTQNTRNTFSNRNEINIKIQIFLVHLFYRKLYKRKRINNRDNRQEKKKKE